MRRRDRVTGGVIATPIRSGKQAGPRWEFLLALALALVYFASAKLGLELAFSNESVTAIWPPTGIALAALVLGGRGLWPGVLLGAFLANVTTDVPVYTAAGIAVGNTLEAVVGAYAARTLRLPSHAAAAARYLRARRARRRCSAPRSAPRSASPASASGTRSPRARSRPGACGGSATWGAICWSASTIFVLVTHWPYRDLPGSAVEALALMVALVGIELVVFTHDVPAAYLAFPIIVWAALRFLQPGATVAALAFAIIAVSFTGQRVGAVLPALAGRRPPPRSELLGDRGPDRPDPGDRHLPAQAGRAPGAAPGARSAGGAAASSASRDPAVRGGRLVSRRHEGTGGRRRLLRRLQGGPRPLGGGDRGRLRQGARSRPP